MTAKSATGPKGLTKVNKKNYTDLTNFDIIKKLKQDVVISWQWLRAHP